MSFSKFDPKCLPLNLPIFRFWGMFTLMLLTSLKVVVVLLGSLVRLGGTSLVWRPVLATYRFNYVGELPCHIYIQYIMFILYHYISHTRTCYIYIYCIYVTYISIYTYLWIRIQKHTYRHTCLFYMQICILTDGHIEGNLNSKYLERRGRWQGRSGCWLVGLSDFVFANHPKFNRLIILSDIPPAFFTNHLAT